MAGVRETNLSEQNGNKPSKPLRGHSINIRVSIIEAWALLVMKTSSRGNEKNPQLIMKSLLIYSVSKGSSTGYDTCVLIPMSSNDYS